MKNVIMTLIIGLTLTTMGFSQEEPNACNTIEDFETTPVGTMGNWEESNMIDQRIQNILNNNVMYTNDGSGATYLFNNTDFPVNLLEAGCELRYDVKYDDGIDSAQMNTVNSIWIFDGPTPSTSINAFKFVLNSPIISEFIDVIFTLPSPIKRS